jgi:hypothetical protein
LLQSTVFFFLHTLTEPIAMPTPRLDHFAADLHLEVLAAAGIDADRASKSNEPLREETFRDHVIVILGDHNEADGVECIRIYEARNVVSIPAAKLSAWSLSGDGATADLFVTLYFGTGAVKEVGLPEVRRQFQLLRGFLRRALEGFHTTAEESSDGFRVPRTNAHITTQDGNPGEVSKRESCWHEFRGKKLSEPNAWRDELSESAFVAVNTQEESLAAEWERVRNAFAGDSRTVGELEAVTGKVWMRTRRGDPIYFYAEKSWEQLRAEKLRGNRKRGITSLRGLVELVSAAAG